MRSFVAGCIAVIVIAAIAAFGLSAIQEPVDVAFTTTSVRL